MAMDILQKSKEIEELYKAGKYQNVIEEATPLLPDLTRENGGPQIHKYCALSVLSACYGQDNTLEIASNAWNRACAFYEDTEELKAFQIGFIEELSDVFIRHGERFLRNFDFASFEKSIADLMTYPLEWSKLSLFLDVNEDDESILEEAKNKFFYDRFWAMAYSFVVSKWSKENGYFVNNNFCGTDVEYSLNLGKKMTAVIMNVNLLLQWTTRFDEEEDKFDDDTDIELCLDRCKHLLTFITECIDANTQVNGGTFYLLGDGRYDSVRYDMLNEFDRYVGIIQRYDAAFVAPDRPNQFRDNDVPAQSSGGCYVATAVYGSYDCPEVWTLRRYRDNTLAETWYGRAFIRTYYAISPTLVKWFGHTEWFKKLWRGKLDRMVGKLQARGVESTAYEDKLW